MNATEKIVHVKLSLFMQLNYNHSNVFAVQWIQTVVTKFGLPIEWIWLAQFAKLATKHEQKLANSMLAFCKKNFWNCASLCSLLSVQIQFPIFHKLKNLFCFQTNFLQSKSLSEMKKNDDLFLSPWKLLLETWQKRKLIWFQCTCVELAWEFKQSFILP